MRHGFVFISPVLVKLILSGVVLFLVGGFVASSNFFFFIRVAQLGYGCDFFWIFSFLLRGVKVSKKSCEGKSA